MRILVAGGAGFIGRHLCRALLVGGHDVSVIDDFSTSDPADVQPLVEHERFALHEQSVIDSLALMPAMDVIVHLASPASPVDYARLPLRTLGANSIGTWNLLERAEHDGASFVYASTSEVYGDPLQHPQSETYRGNVDPIGPRACYDEGKRFGEALISTFGPKRDVRTAIVRIFNTYGPGMRLADGRVIPTFVSAALDGRPLPLYGNGSQTRSFLYIDDLVDAFLRIIFDPYLAGLVVNVGNPDEVTIRKLARMVATLAGSEQVFIEAREPRPDDPRRRRPDIARMTELYAWRPTTGLAEGLAATIAWARTVR